MADVKNMATLGIGATPRSIRFFVLTGLGGLILSAPDRRAYAIAEESRAQPIDSETRVVSIRRETRVYPVR